MKDVISLNYNYDFPESYSSARRKILYSGEISFFDYGGGLVKAVEEDVWKYKRNHCHIAGG